MAKRKSHAKPPSSSILDRFIEVPLESLQRAEWNYKTDDAEMLEKLKANIRRNGQVENLIVRELGSGLFEVVNGNHRLQAMREIGAVSCVAYNLGRATQREAERIAIETNETQFRSDDLRLAALIEGIKLDFPDFTETAPFSAAEFEGMSKLLSFQFDTQAEEKIEKQRPKGSPERFAQVKPAENPITLVGKEEWTPITDSTADQFVTLKMHLPRAVAELFMEQVERFKKILHPDEKDLAKIPAVQPIEAMVATLALTPDAQVLGEDG